MKNKSSLCEQGRVFLAERSLSIPVCESMPVSTANGDINFDYVVNGQTIRVKSRSMTDKKKMRFDNLSEDQKATFKMPFWNQRYWESRDYLIITEGEFDAIAITQLGKPQVVSLPNGSGSVATTFKNNYDYLQQFDVIYIAFDMDAAGEKAVEEAKKLLPVNKFRRIYFPCKDANEWLQEYSPDQKDLEDLMRNAFKISTEEIVNFADVEETFFESRDKGVSTGWAEIDRLIGGIRKGELTVISADTGAGKTTFCINLLCNLLHNDKSGFWINSWEMNYEVIIRKVASNVLDHRFSTEAFTEKQRKDFRHWMRKNNALINPKRSKADIITLNSQIELASKVYGAKYILLDHLDYITSNSKQKEAHERIKESIIAVHEMAMQHDVHIFLIAHPKQIDDPTGKMHMGQLKGSSSIKQYADNIFLLQNMSQADLAIKDNRMKVQIPKNRFFGSKGEVTLRYLAEKDCYVDMNKIMKYKPDLETYKDA